MAKPTVTISDVDELEKSVKDLTSLSQSLRDVFTKINNKSRVIVFTFFINYLCNEYLLNYK